MDPGIYDDLPIEDYHGDPDTISKSGLADFADSPARFKFGEKPRTRAMALGSLVHTAVLEPHRLHLSYLPTTLAVFNESHSRYRDEVARAAGRELVKQAEWDKALRIRDAVHRNPDARDLITEDMIVERTVCWVDPETEVRMRARPDGIAPHARAILDLKTCEDAGAVRFGKDAKSYRYHWQVPIYSDGMLYADGWLPDLFVFLPVEKEPPHLTAAYEVSGRALQLARQQVEEQLRRYADCKKRNHWPGHPGGIQVLDLPEYAYRD